MHFVTTATSNIETIPPTIDSLIDDISIPLQKEDEDTLASLAQQTKAIVDNCLSDFRTFGEQETFIFNKEKTLAYSPSFFLNAFHTLDRFDTLLLSVSNFITHLKSVAILKKETLNLEPLKEFLMYTSVSFWEDSLFVPLVGQASVSLRESTQDLPNFFDSKESFITLIMKPVTQVARLCDDIIYQAAINSEFSESPTSRATNILYIILQYIVSAYCYVADDAVHMVYDINTSKEDDIFSPGPDAPEVSPTDSFESYFSLEAKKAPSQDGGPEGDEDLVAAGEKRLEELDGKLSNQYKKSVKIFAYSIKHAFRAKFFFKKYLGRIDSLYEWYGSQAQLQENIMKGDPTKLLQEDCVELIKTLSDDVVSLSNEILGVARKIGNAKDYATITTALKSYLKQYPVKDTKEPEKEIRENIVKETRFRIASALFQSTKVYGYTPKGIAENGKFPPPNHIVVSTIVKNAHEKPQTQSVSDIFESPDSLSVFGEKDFTKAFYDIYVQTYNKLTSTVSRKTVDLVRKAARGAAKNYMRMAQGVNKTPEEEKRLKAEVKVVKKVETLIDDAMILVWEQKRRILASIEVMLQLTNRIERLAQEGIVSMLKAEKANRDKNYNTGQRTEDEKSHRIVAGRDATLSQKADSDGNDVDPKEAARAKLVQKQNANVAKRLRKSFKI